MASSVSAPVLDMVLNGVRPLTLSGLPPPRSENMSKMGPRSSKLEAPGSKKSGHVAKYFGSKRMPDVIPSPSLAVAAAESEDSRPY